MMTCKWCGNELPFVSWWTGKHLDCSLSSICTGEGGAGSHEPAEVAKAEPAVPQAMNLPSTGGLYIGLHEHQNVAPTPATPQTDQALCDECSGNGRVLEKCPSCTGSGYAPRTQPCEHKNTYSVSEVGEAGYVKSNIRRCTACGADVNGVARTQPCELQAPKPRLKYLQPEQYLSWLKKVDDGDWVNHRYRDAKDNAMASAIRELRDARAEIASLRSQLIDVCPLKKHNEIVERWANRYITEHAARESVEASYRESQTALADAERKGWNDAIEAAARKAESGQTPLGPKRIRALSREPGVSRTPKGEE